jgi:hypothetical protein
VLGYEYHPATEAEYLEAVRHYSRISGQLGLAFVTQIEAAAQRAGQFPEAWPPLPRELRRVRTRRFPYGITYEMRLYGRICGSQWPFKTVGLLLPAATEWRTAPLATGDDEFFALDRRLQQHPPEGGEWSPHVGIHFQAVFG